MPSFRVKLTFISVIALGLLLVGFFLAWYPYSVIENREAQLNQGGLTQAEIDYLESSLVWWRNQGIWLYGPAANIVKAAGILVLIYAIYLILSICRESNWIKRNP
jgi:hypothetical protein